MDALNLLFERLRDHFVLLDYGEAFESLARDGYGVEGPASTCGPIIMSIHVWILCEG